MAKAVQTLEKISMRHLPVADLPELPFGIVGDSRLGLVEGDFRWRRHLGEDGGDELASVAGRVGLLRQLLDAVAGEGADSSK